MKTDFQPDQGVGEKQRKVDNLHGTLAPLKCDSCLAFGAYHNRSHIRFNEGNGSGSGNDGSPSVCHHRFVYIKRKPFVCVGSLSLC